MEPKHDDETRRQGNQNTRELITLCAGKDARCVLFAFTCSLNRSAPYMFREGLVYDDDINLTDMPCLVDKTYCRFCEEFLLFHKGHSSNKHSRIHGCDSFFCIQHCTLLLQCIVHLHGSMVLSWASLDAGIS